jgi:predicted dithiol-disulfide oxidoreductase (DUF899 family)
LAQSDGHDAPRLIDELNGAYHYLDLVPKGRDEDGLKFSMEWVRRHDQY